MNAREEEEAEDKMTLGRDFTQKKEEKVQLFMVPLPLWISGGYTAEPMRNPAPTNESSQVAE